MHTRPEMPYDTTGRVELSLYQWGDEEAELVGTLVDAVLGQRINEQPGSEPTHATIEVEMDEL